MQEKLFTADPTKHKYSIVVDVYENCATVKVQHVKQENVSYHEVVGALETQKQHLMWQQREINLKQKMKPGKKPNPKSK